MALFFDCRKPAESIPVSDKVAHVKEALKKPKAGWHACHWPGCQKNVQPAQWGCTPHWFKLPLALRQKVWTTFKPGQEVSKTPSREYVLVARQVQEWIKNHG